MAKKSWFKFYPQSWLGDSELRILGPEVRGFWMDLLCHMSQANPVGYLVNAAGEPLKVDAIAKLVGIPQAIAELQLKLLLKHKICSFDGNLIFSRKMVRDAEKLEKLEKGGKIRASQLFGHSNSSAIAQANTVASSSAIAPALDILELNTNTDSTKGNFLEKDKKKEKSKDFPKEKEKNTHELEASPSSLCPPQADTPHLKIIDLWHEVCPMLPRVNHKLWDGNRAVVLRARWTQKKEFQNLEFWRRFFMLVASSPFLTGQVTGNGGRAFRATLPWVINAENFKKILEGNYHDRNQTSPAKEDAITRLRRKAEEQK